MRVNAPNHHIFMTVPPRRRHNLCEKDRASNSIKAVQGIHIALMITLFLHTPSPADQSRVTAQSLLAEELEVALSLKAAFPESADALFLLGNVYNHLGQRENALGAWRRGLDRDPQRAQVYVEMGRVLLRQGKYEEALAQWDRVLAMQVTLPDLQGQRARALMGLGRHREALAALELELRSQPESANVHFLAGQVHLLLGDYEQAGKRYGHAIRIAPDHTNAYYGLAKVYTHLQQAEKAKESLSRFKALKSRDLGTLKDENEAYDDLQRVKRRTLEVLLQAQRLYLNAERVQDARLLLNRAIELDPNHLDTMIQLADYHQHTQHLQEAYGVLRRTQERHPNAGAVWMRSGLLAMQLKRPEEARIAFERTVELGFQPAQGYRLLATMHLQLNQDLPEALTWAKRAVSLAPEAENYFVLGWASALNGRPTQAREAIRQAVRLDPSNPKYNAILRSLDQGGGRGNP